MLVQNGDLSLIKRAEVCDFGLGSIYIDTATHYGYYDIAQYIASKTNRKFAITPFLQWINDNVPRPEIKWDGYELTSMLRSNISGRNTNDTNHTVISDNAELLPFIASVLNWCLYDRNYICSVVTSMHIIGGPVRDLIKLVPDEFKHEIRNLIPLLIDEREPTILVMFLGLLI
jgi:hypothetical protein